MAQKRIEPKCPFVDMETFRCAVYEVRPLVCRLYGYSPRLICSYAPDLVQIEKRQELESSAGLYDADLRKTTILGIHYTWKELAAHAKA